MALPRKGLCGVPSARLHRELLLCDSRDDVSLKGAKGELVSNGGQPELQLLHIALQPHLARFDEPKSLDETPIAERC